MTEHTTKIAPTLTAATTRRGALRLLTGVALASSGLATLGATESNAKKKKSRKGKNGGKDICGDKRHARVRVPHDGSVVYTEKLKHGKRYRLRVSGYLTGSGTLLPSAGVDAGYLFKPGGDPSLARDVYAGIDFGLSIDGAAANWGSSLETDHVYNREVLGEGKKLALRMVTQSAASLTQSSEDERAPRRVIEVNPNLDLSGSLLVEILCD